MAIRAGALEREKSLGVADPALAAAHRAGFRFGAGLGAGAGARLAADRGWNTHLRILARVGLLKRDFHIVAQISAALAAGTAATAARHAENAFEQIGKRGAELSAETGRPATAHALLEGGVAETIIGRALVRVLQDLIGFVDFLEAMLGVLVARITIR